MMNTANGCQEKETETNSRRGTKTNLLSGIRAKSWAFQQLPFSPKKWKHKRGKSSSSDAEGFLAGRLRGKPTGGEKPKKLTAAAVSPLETPGDIEVSMSKALRATAWASIWDLYLNSHILHIFILKVNSLFHFVCVFIFTYLCFLYF